MHNHILGHQQHEGRKRKINTSIMEKILDKFLRYISFDTASDPQSETQPSTTKQCALLGTAQELHQMGITDAHLDEYGYVMASIPSNLEKEVPAIGFLAHVDTSPDASGRISGRRSFPNTTGNPSC